MRKSKRSELSQGKFRAVGGSVTVQLFTVSASASAHPPSYYIHMHLPQLSPFWCPLARLCLGMGFLGPFFKASLKRFAA